MKLSGIIVVLLVMVASCQKEDIRPNGPMNASGIRKCSNSSTTTTVSPTSTGDNGGIVDPNTDTDASSTGKKGNK